MPKNWRKKTGASGSGRVAVIVSSESMPYWGEQAKLLKEAMKQEDEGQPRWSGVLRSNYTNVDFPAAEAK